MAFWSRYSRVSYVVLAILLLAACGGATPAAPAAMLAPATPATNVPASAAATTQPATSAPAFDLARWDSVPAAARGQTVNWYLWGGSESINTFVDTFYGQPLKGGDPPHPARTGDHDAAGYA